MIPTEGNWDFKIQDSGKDILHTKVNFLQAGQEYVPKNRQHFQHLL
jgi:hypothetical protein